MSLTGCGDDGGGSAEGAGDTATVDDGATTMAPGDAGEADETATDTGPGGGETGGLDPADVDPDFSDEFDDASTLSGWMRAHQVEGRDAQYSTMDIDESTAGALTIVPTRDGWFGDFDGPLLFKMVSGDFVVETLVTAGNTADPDSPPTQFFNSAGLLVRDPSHSAGQENWIMHNVGFQSEFVGSEGKTTANSESMLTLVPGARRGRIRMCRFGDRFVLVRRLDDDQGGFMQTHEFARPELPDDLQVGLVANGWNSEGLEPDPSITPDLRASFDYIRLWRPQSEADCMAD